MKTATLSFLLLLLFASLRAQETPQSLVRQWTSPPAEYRPHAWWHWMGANYSRDGITRDLEAMKEAGLGGAVVFNSPSWLDPSRNPWPQQTWRGDAYWDAFGHALSEARRLGMEVGLHNSPGWSTTGGPWIDPEKDGMKAATFSTLPVTGGKLVDVSLPLPAGRYYKDVTVMAVRRPQSPAAFGTAPQGESGSDAPVVDLTACFSPADGTLRWDAPAGGWTVYRFGYFSTMQRTHPTPEDVEQTSYEADKMSLPATAKHWRNVLDPLTERFTSYIGTTFRCIWTDSYEAWGQSWTPHFRTEFIRLKGYDPVPQLILAYERGDSILNTATNGLEDDRDTFAPATRAFLTDYRRVVSRLMLRCWQQGKEMINAAGFQFCFEPYGSIIPAPFDMEEGTGIADIPVTEFWVHSGEPSGGVEFALAAARHDKRIVGAEAFTGMEATCHWNETPAMLKRPADMAFAYGINRLYLHSWAHNPLTDDFHPGWAFAHYGTHFSRNQTWFKPGKAFFTYLARCQMLLQQGTLAGGGNETCEWIARRTPETEILFVRNPSDTIKTEEYGFTLTGRVPELWDAYRGAVTTPRKWRVEGGKTFVTLTLEKNESMFIVLPLTPTIPVQHAPIPPGTARTEEKTTESEIDMTYYMHSGKWDVTFTPATAEKPFRRTFAKLLDWSNSRDKQVRYFSGTATYRTAFEVRDLASHGDSSRAALVLDLGEVHDLAEVELNGRPVGVLWMPPYRVDVSPYLKKGGNELTVRVTNTWVNRMIGDEQYPADFERITRESNGLPAMNYLPAWATDGTPRPSAQRKTFVPWMYFDKTSSLEPAGLVGPLRLGSTSLGK
jgi:hypothetical protein